MYDSQTIQSVGTTDTEYLSPWFPRGGDYGLFTLEVTALGDNWASGTLDLTVTLLHKNREDTGDADAAISDAGDITLSASGRTTVDYKEGLGTSTIFNGFKELVRYKIVLKASATSGELAWATFRMLPPVWYDNVKA